MFHMKHQQATTTEPVLDLNIFLKNFGILEKNEVNMEEFGKSYTNLEKYVGGKKEELRDQIVDEFNKKL